MLSFNGKLEDNAPGSMKGKEAGGRREVYDFIYHGRRSKANAQKWQIKKYCACMYLEKCGQILKNHLEAVGAERCDRTWSRRTRDRCFHSEPSSTTEPGLRAGVILISPSTTMFSFSLCISITQPGTERVLKYVLWNEWRGGGDPELER